MKLLHAVAALIVATVAVAGDGSTVFVEQVLEPIGGKIQRPKDWYYTEAHRGTTYRWIISKEDVSGGKRYKTGLSLQTFVGVKEKTGKTAEQFIREVVASKAGTTKTLRECQATSQGMFVRMCLETEEGPYRISYSLFWGADGLDIAVVSVAGAPKEEWQRYQPVFERMAVFEIIDMKRFPKR